MWALGRRPVREQWALVLAVFALAELSVVVVIGLAVTHAEAVERARAAGRLSERLVQESGCLSTALTDQLGHAARVVYPGATARLLQSGAPLAPNSHTKFDIAALEQASTLGEDGYVEREGGRVHFARHISCEGDTAPSVLAVSVPLQDPFAFLLAGEGVSRWLLMLLALPVAAPVWVWWAVWRRSFKQLAMLERFSTQLVEASPGETVERLTLDPEEVTSANEVHRVAANVKALCRALRLAQSGRS